MIKSFFHSLWGHTWMGMSWSYNAPPFKPATGFYLTTDDQRMTIYGFTQVTLICKCGLVKDIRLIGNQEPKNIKKES